MTEKLIFPARSKMGRIPVNYTCFPITFFTGHLTKPHFALLLHCSTFISLFFSSAAGFFGHCFNGLSFVNTPVVCFTWFNFFMLFNSLICFCLDVFSAFPALEVSSGAEINVLGRINPRISGLSVLVFTWNLLTGCPDSFTDRQVSRSALLT